MFDLPRVLYHGLWDNNRYVLLTTAVGGRTLDSWRPTINEEMKTRCVNRVFEACKELAQRLSGRAGGRSYTNDDLVAASKEMGMNCYVPFHFYHCDLGPGNIIVDVKEDDDDDRSISVGIIDWEIAGFVPWD
ncbi:malate dehydrogenase [Apiospora arundinis]